MTENMMNKEHKATNDKFRKGYDKIKWESEEYIDPSDICPECGAKLKTLWSGVKCTKCDYWFCY